MNFPFKSSKLFVFLHPAEHWGCGVSPEVFLLFSVTPLLNSIPNKLHFSLLAWHAGLAAPQAVVQSRWPTQSCSLHCWLCRIAVGSPIEALLSPSTPAACVPRGAINNAGSTVQRRRAGWNDGWSHSKKVPPPNFRSAFSK